MSRSGPLFASLPVSQKRAGLASCSVWAPRTTFADFADRGAWSQTPSRSFDSRDFSGAAEEVPAPRCAARWPQAVDSRA